MTTDASSPGTATTSRRSLLRAGLTATAVLAVPGAGLTGLAGPASGAPQAPGGNDNRRGYVRIRFTASELTADFRAVPYVRQPGTPVGTKATFVVEDRNPGLNPLRPCLTGGADRWVRT